MTELQPAQRGVGELGLGQVVRHVDGEARRRRGRLSPSRSCEQRGHAARHLHGAEDGGLVAADEPRVGGVRALPDRAGVRHRHRDAVDADREGDAEGLDQLPDRLDDPLPLVVRLEAVQHEERLAVAVDHAVEHQRRVGVAGPAVAVEDHRGAAAAVVDQLVDVEGRDDGVLERGEDVLGHQLAGCARRRRSRRGTTSSTEARSSRGSVSVSKEYSSAGSCTAARLFLAGVEVLVLSTPKGARGFRAPVSAVDRAVRPGMARRRRRGSQARLWHARHRDVTVSDRTKLFRFIHRHPGAAPCLTSRPAGRGSRASARARSSPPSWPCSSRRATTSSPSTPWRPRSAPARPRSTGGGPPRPTSSSTPSPATSPPSPRSTTTPAACAVTCSPRPAAPAACATTPPRCSAPSSRRCTATVTCSRRSASASSSPSSSGSIAAFERARDRGEVGPGADLHLLANTLSAICVHDTFVYDIPATPERVAHVIDSVVLPAARATLDRSPA